MKRFLIAAAMVLLVVSCVDAKRKNPETVTLSKDVLKKNTYYAVVRSDGDRISKIIQELNPSQTRIFSRTCLEYCSKIASMVHDDYGGVTIYSGGDDLLALMPVQNHNGKTIFDFTVEANNLFQKSFSENQAFEAVFSALRRAFPFFWHFCFFL